MSRVKNVIGFVWYGWQTKLRSRCRSTQTRRFRTNIHRRWDDRNIVQIRTTTSCIWSNYLRWISIRFDTRGMRRFLETMTWYTSDETCVRIWEERRCTFSVSLFGGWILFHPNIYNNPWLFKREISDFNCLLRSVPGKTWFVRDWRRHTSTSKGNRVSSRFPQCLTDWSL